MTSDSSESDFTLGIGEDIITTSIDGKSSMEGGTSLATPYVAGYAAYLLTLDSSLTPAAVDSTIKSKALKNVLSGVRKFTNFSTVVDIIQDSHSSQ